MLRVLEARSHVENRTIATRTFRWDFAPRGFVGLLIITAALAGCDGPKGLDADPRRAAATSIPAGELSRTLGLRVVSSSSYTCSMENRLNAVLLMGPPCSGVIVNGRRVSDGRGITVSDGQLMIPQETAMAIRAELRAIPAPAPVLGGQLRPTQGNQTLLPPVRPAPVVRGVVVLDAGHGGTDPGASNLYGPVEKDIALDITRRVRDTLRSHGVQVIMTRDSDTFVELDYRPAIANRARADLFVAIHADSIPEKTYIQGSHVLVSEHASAASTTAGRCMVSSLSAIGPSRGMRSASLRVLRLNDRPCMLIETGFLTNPTEGRRLSSPAYRQRLAVAIASGIERYLANRG